MKPTGISFLIITTLVLITVTIFALMNFPLGWIFSITLLGETLLIYTVLRILKDDYTTDKTFEDFYEDYPVGKGEM